PKRLRFVDGMLTYIGSKAKAARYRSEVRYLSDDIELNDDDAFGAAFGLTQRQANRVVYGYNHDYVDTKEDAINCLTDMIEEGKE
ncbi:MAG: hypothetical protein MN733_07530, partial [Nitrososphaera sp.]|nr:hypothetical protein [Nitrososphaera sp.]